MADLAPISFSLDDIAAAAAQFWQSAKDYRHIAFSGGLGAGKTTFVHALCRHLGVTDAVSSPTFALINEYHFMEEGAGRVIYHMDWYRLRDAAEAVHAGMEDCLLRADARCFIEWPEQAAELLRSPYLWVSIAPLEAAARILRTTIR